MGKFKIAISFDTQFLNTLKDTEKSGVEIQRRKHHLALHPIQLNHFNDSIKEILKEGVAKYSKELKGILLGYENIKLMSGGGILHDDSCYNHFDIEADFFVFKPEAGEEMQGIVTRKSKDHVGLLVYNTFNVSIPAPHDQVDWLGKCVKIGYNVLFKIVYFSFTSHLPYIKGELISILSEVESGNTSETNNTSPKESKKANKKIYFGDESLSQELHSEESILVEDPSEFNESRKMKKSKKNKLASLDDDNEFSFSDIIESELKNKDLSMSVIIPKKKRTKKVKLEDTVSDFESKDNGDLSIVSVSSPKKKKTKRVKLEDIVSDLESKDNGDLSIVSVNSPKKKRTKKLKMEDIDSDFESKDNGDLTLSFSSPGKKRTKNVKLEDTVSDFENSLNLSDSKKAKKRKNSFSEMSEVPKKKKKRNSYDML